MKARVAVLLFSVFLAVASVGLARREHEEVQGKQQPAPNNPYYLPSHQFKTRFENKNGSIEVLEQFDKLSEHLQFLQEYRIVRYRARPGTVVLPHHSDAEYLLIVTNGSAIVKVYTEAEDKHPPLILNQFDVLRVPAGAISYTINSGGSQRDEDLELIKLALPQNNPGQFQDLYPTGNFTPSSYYEVFSKKTLQAAFNAEYEEIKEALWGPEQWKNETIVELSPRKIRSLIKGAKSSSSEGAHVPLTYLGPVPLRDIKPIYLNDFGSFHEARPSNKFPSLKPLGVGASYLNLSNGSMFLPHYNPKAIILAYVASGEGQSEMGSPYPINKQEQQEEEEEEGYIERLAANVSSGDLYIIPAGYPVAVSASENSELKVVEFILNAENNSRLFLTGKEDNAMKHIDPTLLSKTPEKLEKLLHKQSHSFFVKREEQPSEDDKPIRKANRVAWSSF